MRMPDDWSADQLALVGDQHDLVAFLDRERADQPPGLASVTFMATMPLPPRPVVRYSKDEERLPKPRSDTVSTNCSAADNST